MKTMQYKGYHAKIEFDADDRIFVGYILGIVDVISFHGESVAELEEAFHEAIDNYLESCAKLNQQPNKPYSGKLMLRLKPELHAAVAKSAELEGLSINRWVAGVLQSASHH
ncbi:type II toxin-antitoxin system HicB family antitoxin [Maridesulfovibrio hydrothermalis]|uniref:HicB n=1 Tax=Maridesulfovibrio hydrothermalis AM13 = DSM 14728 TaxID=1121451 RepID=L0RBA9_9BACT|nr:type II toxin-antitoxin system HicB family antitoxin [Maridesulfovibrio hydrothermalis]CCO24039.1 HicB [Maridesulfovibrio hydrothermalis AM13 = DSM 14728]